MSAPLILVIPDISNDDQPEPLLYLRKNYTTALIDQGGAPLIVPYTNKLLDQYMDIAHGLYIIGGGFTIDPQLFNQEMRCSMPIKSERTQLEWAYCEAALARKMPILGICGGMQLINVVLGGDLIQDLSQRPNTLSHNVSGEPEAHAVRIVNGTQLAQYILEENISVNSSHQQSVDRLGRNVYVNAVAPDGVIEGIEYPAHPFCIGVQWHPEYTHQDQRVIRAFVGACTAYASTSVD